MAKVNKILGLLDGGRFRSDRLILEMFESELISNQPEAQVSYQMSLVLRHPHKFTC